MTEIFCPSELEKTARKSKFIQRSSSLPQGKDFVDLMTAVSIDSKSMSLEGLCHALREINPESDLTPQSLTGAYFLSRVPACVVVYLKKEDKEPVDLAGYINRHFPSKHD
jgi:hypothetical protein